MTVRRPISWCSGPLVYGEDLHDPWAVFRLPTESYDGRDRQHKLQLVSDVRDLIHYLAADFKIDRVSSWWDGDDYLRQQRAAADQTHHDAREDYLLDQLDELPITGASSPTVFLSVSLREPRASRSEEVSRRVLGGLRGPSSLRELWNARKGDLGLSRRDELPAEQLEADHAAVSRLLERIEPYLAARPATGTEVEWLIRRCWTRGLGEPNVDGVDQLPALEFERNGHARLQVDTAAVLRFADYVARDGHQRLHVAGELGDSYQSGLIASSLPADEEAPSDTLELLFRPAELLPFPLDIALTGKWVPNSRALARAESLIGKADEDHRSEATSERGATDEAHDRTGLARDLRLDLRESRRPQVDGTLSVVVSAATRELLDERVARTRAVFSEFGAAMRLPVAQQLELFLQHLPAQRVRVTGYQRQLSPTQIGAMTPTATHAVGSSRGWVLGTTQSARPIPVRFDPREGSRTNRPSGILVLGEPGYGKTMLAGKLALEAAFDGARIVDEDPKGDHRWMNHPALTDHVERVTLAPDPKLRGLLDPWINAPNALRVNAAQSFLMALLPRGDRPEWDTALLRAIHEVNATDRPTNVAVLRALASGDATARRVAEHLEVHAESGLAQLGFADHDRAGRQLGGRQITYVLSKGLPMPGAGTRRRDYSPSEVVGEQVSHLLSLLVMRLMGEHPDTLKMAFSDEAWARLKTSQGRDTFDALQRLGRSELLVPVAATQLATDIGIDRDSIANLFGAYAVFHCSGDEARRALELVGLDPDDRAMVTRIESLQPGQCLLRDHAGRVEFVDVALTSGLLEQLQTTPAGATTPRAEVDALA